MPELPDLEVYAENVRPLVADKVVARVEVPLPKVLGRGRAMPIVSALTGRTIQGVARRGKTLGFTTDAGDRLDVDLMLGGEMHCLPREEYRVPFSAFVIHFADGSRLVFADEHLNPIRPTAPFMHIGLNTKEKFGVDPLSPWFTSATLATLARRRQLGSVKELLMDQKAIGGIGNAYADEILWAARIRPKMPASLLSDGQIADLHREIVGILADAIPRVRHGLEGGIRGEVWDFFSVHGKRSKPCPRCKHAVAVDQIRIRSALRSTYWCPACQP